MEADSGDEAGEGRVSKESVEKAAPLGFALSGAVERAFPRALEAPNARNLARHCIEELSTVCYRSGAKS